MNVACKTGGRAFPWLPETDYNQWSARMLQEALALNIDDESAAWLIKRHAIRVTKIFELIVKDPALAERILPELPFIVADLIFCMQNEMVVHLDDLLRRRIPLFILSKMTFSKLKVIAEKIAGTLAWTSEKINSELALCKGKGLLSEEVR